MLHSHLEEQGVEYIQFAFRWMNCLLMRELSVRNIVRMWDTYLVRFLHIYFLILAQKAVTFPRLKDLMPFLTFTYTFALRFSIDGMRNCERWTFKESSCFSKAFRRRSGQLKRRNYYSQTPLCELIIPCVEVRNAQTDWFNF